MIQEIIKKHERQQSGLKLRVIAAAGLVGQPGYIIYTIVKHFAFTTVPVTDYNLNNSW
jgi:hypothetical protein